MKMINPFKYSLATRLKQPHILKLLDVSTQEKVLDLGCGLGYFAQLFKEKNIGSYLGLDICFESLLSAKKATPFYFLNSSATEVAIKDNSFDKILISELIEHIQEDEKLLKEIYRISKQGAVVIITTTCLDSPLVGTRFNLLFHDRPGTPEYHVRAGYGTEELLQLMRKYNILPVEVKYTAVFLGEVFMELTKLFYCLSKQRLDSQKEIEKVNKTFLFNVYRLVIFPIFYFISKFEEKMLSKIFKGHSIIVKGKVSKKNYG
jgi:ubiquinone/menaquinone biosynthesis C-methylase UbiE